MADEQTPPPAPEGSSDGSDQGGDKGGDKGGDLGGDPACWLNRVCPECGRFAEGSGARCEQCGHELVM
jgi:hypothetical protein